MIGVIIVASTLYDVLTTTSLRRLIHRSAAVNDDDDHDDRNGLITDQQTPVFGTADDQPLILTTTPTYTQGLKMPEIYVLYNI